MNEEIEGFKKDLKEILDEECEDDNIIARALFDKGYRKQYLGTMVSQCEKCKELYSSGSEHECKQSPQLKPCTCGESVAKTVRVKWECPRCGGSVGNPNRKGTDNDKA